MEARRAASSSHNSSVSKGSSAGDHTRCCHGAVESAVSAGVLCVCCPLAVLWCCVKLPCKFGWRSAKHAVEHATCCGSGRRVVTASSSFSDIDFDCPSSPNNTVAGMNTRKTRKKSGSA